MAYAENTSVSVDRSKTEIERIVTRYGATGFMVGSTTDKGMVAFEADGRMIRFLLPIPGLDSPLLSKTVTGLHRTKSAVKAAHEQEQRRRWRALALAIKAKLEAVESQITQFDEEFLAHIVMPNGRTVAETAVPAIAEAYRTKQMPALLPGY